MSALTTTATLASARRPLTAGQERFCIEYLATGNRTAAVRAAYPAARTGAAVSERGRRLMRRPNVLARIRELRAVSRDTDLGVMPTGPAGAGAGPSTDVKKLERAAAIAFDDSVPDVVRLIALRSVSDGLRRWQAAYCGGTSRIIVQIHLDAVEPVAMPEIKKPPADKLSDGGLS